MSSLLLAASLGCALWFWLGHAGKDSEPAHWRVSTVKTAGVALLVPFAILQGAPWLIVAGLALGALGDLALSRPGTAAFLAGMAAFAMGHAAYALAFVHPPQGVLVWLFAAGIVGLVASTELWLAPRTGALRGPVRAYGVIIGLMALAALTLPDRPIVVIGAVFFVISDLVLALRLFVLDRGRVLAARILWPLYYLGQLLICLGMIAP